MLTIKMWEGESLFNDGIALVLLSLITTIHLQGSFSLSEGIQQMAIAFPHCLT